MVDERYIAKRIRELRKNANMDVDTVGKAAMLDALSGHTVDDAPESAQNGGIS